MRKQIYLFNNLVTLYNRSRAKLARLVAQNKNARKQDILKRRIAKLFLRLTGLNKAIRLGFASVALIGSSTMLVTSTAKAQSFAPEAINTFGLDSAYANRPTFADLDNDGDKDMMIGDTLGNNLYYKNSGTAAAPNFDAPVINPFGLTPTTYFSFPYFVDLDNDGDFDILAGDIYGAFYYYANTGTASSPAFAAWVAAPFSLPSGGTGDYTATLSMADMDNDGDKDLFAGGFTGNFYYYPNNGTASAASFGSPLTNPFSIVIPGDSLSVPVLGDLDGDGDFDLLSGSYYGNFHYYQNTGTVSAPAFATAQINPFGLTPVYGGLSLPELADLDNDGDLDLMSGEYYGAWHYFQNNYPLSAISSNIEDITLTLFPNPASNSITIFTSKSFAHKICINNVSGKEVASFVPVAYKTTMDISHYEKGIYLVSIYTQTGIETVKLLKQ
jgi:hypothetical protein